MLKSTRERIVDDLALEALAPEWPEPDTSSAVVAPRVSPARRAKFRRLGGAGLVVAAALAGWFGAQRFDQPARTPTPTWMATCQAARTATAKLHQLQAVQLEQQMQATWAVVAGARSGFEPLDTERNAQVERDAGEATARCVSPTPPSA